MTCGEKKIFQTELNLKIKLFPNLRKLDAKMFPCFS